eukprot:4896498-Prymnesium_polylepis.1
MKPRAFSTNAPKHLRSNGFWRFRAIATATLSLFEHVTRPGSGAMSGVSGRAGRRALPVGVSTPPASRGAVPHSA